ncbi:PREDICTED: multimerin-2 [Elephantulus edwardii]|uniref:multimerin-2 n=1 Tax=Elephantulus edwardii TaxID=28737 RepID=UPI0003F077DE|nr:PREDICTED: multimerin-2 [Elephantulus edwardii]
MLLMLLLGLGGPLAWGLLGACTLAPGAHSAGPHTPRQPETWGSEAEDTIGDPSRRNWCPYQKYKLVTFIAACKTEKFLIHSQQPCPQSAPKCQKIKVMYRMASKPMYQVKQKVLASVAWRCCPGYVGPDCQHHVPMSLSEPADPGDSHQEPWEVPVSAEHGFQVAEIRKVTLQQEHQLQELQNDFHQLAGSLEDIWTASESNLTEATAQANQTELELPNRPLEQVLRSQMEAFLRVHFSSIWRDFNKSLHDLSQTLTNLSHDVETNRLAIQRIQESIVASADFQELGAKFESKVQETVERVGQLRQDVEDRLHLQNLSLQRSLEEVQVNMDTKLKRFYKAQELLTLNGSLLAVVGLGAGARPEPESLQARLGQLQRNLSSLHVDSGRREEELQRTLEDIRTTLAQHGDEIKELYSESDETFDEISKVERQVQELYVNHTALRELRVILMEKSLIMEENKEEMERHLLELNLTLQHLQGGHADLIKYIKDCNCQKLYLDMDVIREGQRDTTQALEETQVNLEERRPLESPAVHALRAAMEDLSLAVDAQRAEAERASADKARLRTQLHVLLREVAELQAAEGSVRVQLRLLNSSFGALLEDALRHEAVLVALFGEEMLEALSEDDPSPLPLSYEQIRLGLQEAASGLREQAFGWATLASRVSALEQAASSLQGWVGPEAEHLEPSHEVPREGDPSAERRDLFALKGELQLLGAQVQRAEQCCEASRAAGSSDSLSALESALFTTQLDLERHQQLFHSLFGNFQGLVAGNVSLDLEKLQAMLSRKEKKQKGLKAPGTRDKKQAEQSLLRGHGRALVTDPGEAGFPVAFYASYSEKTSASKTVKFNTTYINIGSSYFPEHGYFQAPERGVYLFAVSIEFGPGPGTGQLVFGGHHQTPVSIVGDQRSGSPAVTFALAELQKGERVWFELTQGLVTPRAPTASTFGGFLIFKT